MSEHEGIWTEYRPTYWDGWSAVKRMGDLVRCRDCKHYTDDEMEYYHYCGSWCEQVTPDGFCAWGERRDA
jgi:hypothetical protein